MANVKATDLIEYTRASEGYALAKVSYGEELVSSSDRNQTATSTDEIVGVEVDPISVEIGKIYFVSATVTATSTGTFKNPDWGVGEPNIDPVQSNTFDLLNEQDAYEDNVETNVYGTVIPNQSTIGVAFRVGGDSSGDNTLTVSNISVKEVTFNQADGTLQLFQHPDNIPRIEYDADGNLLGLLIEEARTNLVTYSDVDTTNWTGGAFANISTESVSNPFGFSSVVKVVPTTDTAGGAPKRTVQKSINVTTGTTYTYSAFVKAAGYNAAYIIFTDRPNVYGGVAYDLSTASLIELDGGNQGTLSNPFIEDFGDGWYRIGFSHDGDGGKDASNGVAVGFVPTGLTKTVNYGQSSFAGDGISGGYVAGVQVEAGSFPTSYIKTTGNTASRSADVAKIDVDQFGYNQGKGTVFAEANPIPVGSGYGLKVILNLSNGTDNDEIFLLNENNDRLRLILDPTGASNDVDFTISGAEGSLKYAAAWELNNVNAAHGGVLGAGDTSATPIQNATTMTISSTFTQNAKFSGHIKSIKYFPKRLSNAKLQELTS
jgi:hypothetical protein